MHQTLFIIISFTLFYAKSCNGDEMPVDCVNSTSTSCWYVDRYRSRDVIISTSSDQDPFLDEDGIRDFERRYRETDAFRNVRDNCQNRYGYADIGSAEIQEAIRAVGPMMGDYRKEDEKIVNQIEMAKSANFFVAQLAHESKFATLITNYLTKTYCIRKRDIVLELPKLDMRDSMSRYSRDQYSPNSCSKERYSGDIKCVPNTRYPSYDGSCNNLKYPILGMSYTCHRRILPADYADGIEKFRVGVDGEPLPNARLISNVLTPDVPILEEHLTQMNMQWGQLVVHDLVRTPLILGNAPLCCPPKPSNHPECEVIFPFPPGDSMTKRWNQTCQRNVRSTMCPTCGLGPRQLLNAATHYLDLSNLYGYTYQDAMKVRSGQRGLLKSTYDAKGGEIMPSADGFYDPLTLQVCNIPPAFPEFKCFASGDGNRASQHPALNALQTLLLRRHNQHAMALAKINPEWNDEVLYWETRRILTAEINHITFAEYLPSLLPADFLDYFGLLPQTKGYTKYNPSVDGASQLEWATAAGRFGHSQVNDKFFIKDGDSVVEFRMKDVFFEMSLIHLGQTDGITKGLVTEKAFAVDPYFVVDVKDFMYQHPNRSGGLDLVGLNVMRGRDHGIPGYIYFLDYCFGYKAKEWSDLEKYIPAGELRKLRDIYRDVRDLELFIGGLAENKMKGSLMGPTFACLNGIQFHHTKFGDRYFYEHGGEAGSFEANQLDNIRKTSTLARLICKTTGIKAIQRQTMFMPSGYNPEIDCKEYPEIDYELWRERARRF